MVCMETDTFLPDGVTTLLIQMRTIVVKPGHAAEVVERFSRPAPVEQMPGLIDRTVMVNKRSKDREEIVVMIRWESEEAWKNWEKSDIHIQGHREKRGQTPPDYVISSTVGMYEVMAVREGEGGTFAGVEATAQ